MKMIKRLQSCLNRILRIICGCLLGFMAVLTCYQVFMRYVMKNPSTMSEDILSYSFVWLSLLAAALVFGERDHMNLTFFVNKLPGTANCVLQIFTELLNLFIAIIVFLFGGIKFMGVGALQVSPTLGITMNVIYSIMPISGILVAIYSVINIMELLTGWRLEDKA